MLPAQANPTPAAPPAGSLVPTGGEAALGLPPALTSPLSLGTLLQALRRRWQLVLGVGLLAGLLGAGIAWLVVPGKYQAQATIHIASYHDGDADLTNFKQTQAMLVKSYTVLHAVLEKPEIADLAEVRSQDDRVTWLQRNLETDFLLGPEVLRVSFNADRAEDGTILVNEVCRAYLHDYQAREENKLAAKVKQLQENQHACEERLRGARQKLEHRREELGIEDDKIGAIRLEAAEKQVGSAEDRSFQVQLELKKLAAELAAQRAKLKNPPPVVISDFEVEEEMRNDETVKQYRKRIAELEQQLQTIKSVGAPEMRAGLMQKPMQEKASLEDAVTTLKDSIHRHVETRLQARTLDNLRANVAKLEIDIQATNEQKEALDQEVQRLKKQAEKVRQLIRAPDKPNAELAALRDEVNGAEFVLQQATRTLADVQVNRDQLTRVTLAEAAPVPQSRKIDRQLKAAGAAGFGLFALAALGVLLVECRSRRVYVVEDVVQGLGMSLVGTLPALSAPARRALPGPASPRDLIGQLALTESIDAIRTVMLHSSHTLPLRVVMVTSALGGEGKTSLASHLAASLARAGRTTLLLDCDLRKPAAHGQFDLPQSPGMCDGLRGEIEFEEAIQATPLRNLWLLPAGQWDSHASQALAAEDLLPRLFERLKKQYDFLIIDVSPVLPVSDALVIGQYADAALFSILRDVSRLPAVYAAQRRLSSLGIRMLGAVVIGESVSTYGLGYQYPAPAAT
jgi:succinoglycan biosynthesis transport protein ExoP